MSDNSNNWENEEYQNSEEYESEDEVSYEEDASSDDEYDEEYEEYDENSEYEEEYSEDGEVTASDDESEYEEYDEESDGEEYSEDGEEDEDEEDESDEDSEEEALKKKILIGGIAAVILIVLVAGGFLGMKMMKKNSENVIASIENVDETGISEENPEIKSETIVDENGEELTVIDIENEDAPESSEAKKPVLPKEETEKTAEATVEDKSNLEIEDSPKPAKMSKENDDTVDVVIGEVGRKNPFLPQGVKTAAGLQKESSSTGFEIIEPPSLAPTDSNVAKLLSTKVTGIMYDNKSPSAIINIDGLDQLVKIGDELDGFYILNITKNKVIIQSDANIYKASVGQPLNSEKVVNSTEISNLRNKFYGSTH